MSLAGAAVNSSTRLEHRRRPTRASLLRQQYASLGALEPVWDELYPTEQPRILRLLIERIDVAPDGISVTLHGAGIRSLVAELADQEAPARGASEPLLETAE